MVWNVQEETTTPPTERTKVQTAFFCHAVAELGRFCFDTPQACLQSADRHEGPCAVFSTAHCVTYKRVVDNRRAGRCFSNPRVCRDTSVEMTASADYEEVSACVTLAADPAAVNLGEIDLAELSAMRTGWWCSVSATDSLSSFCSRSRPQCQRMRTQHAGAFTDCTEQKRAACFTYWSTLEQAEKTECRASFADCQAFRAMTVSRADDAEKVGACAATE